MTTAAEPAASGRGAEIVVRLPRPHPGQVRVLESPARFRVIRCGRRWGKTTCGLIEACRDTMAGLPVGWFAPSYKIFVDAWEQLEQRLAPVTRSKSVQHKRIVLITGGVLEGWSLDTDDPGRSRKYAKAIIDEAGLVENLKDLWLQSIRPTLVDYEGGALFQSTPKLIGPYFNELFDLGDPDNEDRDPEWESFRGRTVDNRHLPNVRAEVEKARRSMPEWMFRQEYEGEPAEGHAAFFSARVIRQHKRTHARDPLVRGTIDVEADLAPDRDRLLKSARRLDRIAWTEDADRGPWRLWCELVPDGEGRLRPDQARPYAAGMDLGRGVGASNTAVKVYDAETRETVAEFVHPGVTPAEMARLWTAAGYWFGGLSGFCAICPEFNGPGEELIKGLLELGYPGIYRERTGGATARERVTPKFGWTSTHQSKEAALGAYRAAVASGRLTERSAETLAECLKYRYDEYGRIVCDDDEVSADEPARAPHGDRVIASALGLLCCGYAPKVQPERRTPPVGSLQWLRDREEEQKRGKRW